MSRKSEIEKAVKQFETKFGKKNAEWFELGIHYVLGNPKLFSDCDRTIKDMTPVEVSTADSFLRYPFSFCKEHGIDCEIDESQDFSTLPLKEAAKVIDYLTSINVDPYAD